MPCCNFDEADTPPSPLGARGRRTPLLELLAFQFPAASHGGNGGADDHSVGRGIEPGYEDDISDVGGGGGAGAGAGAGARGLVIGLVIGPVIGSGVGSGVCVVGREAGRKRPANDFPASEPAILSYCRVV